MKLLLPAKFCCSRSLSWKKVCTAFHTEKEFGENWTSITARRFSSSSKDITFPKCECNHITWGNKEFVGLLSEEVKRLSLLSTSDTQRSSHKNLTHNFVHLSSAIEKLLFLQNWDDVHGVSNKFKSIDPDSIKISTDEEIEGNSVDTEMSFITDLSPYLKQAGFTEIDTEEVKKLFSNFHKYGDIELQVNFEDFEFLKIWVFGQSGSQKEKSKSWKAFTKKHLFLFSSEGYKVGSELCHRRVVVAARNKKRSHMIFKCFKDIPVGHFEALLPEAKIIIPRSLRWALNFFLISSGTMFFVNFGLDMLAEYKFDYFMVGIAVAFFIIYRTKIMYRNRRNTYSLIWKQMLYYKSTSNNSALVVELLNRARGQLFKKTILAYVASLQVAKRNKENGIAAQEIEEQCDAWIKKMSHNYPDRKVGVIDFSPGISNLLNMGILSYTENNMYEVMDVASTLKKIEKELISHCTEICDST